VVCADDAAVWNSCFGWELIALIHSSQNCSFLIDVRLILTVKGDRRHNGETVEFVTALRFGLAARSVTGKFCLCS
jgi:hypothetical protein